MNLLTDRLQLKEVSWDDLDNIFFLHSNPDVEKYNTIGIPETIEVTRSFLSPFIDDNSNPRKQFLWALYTRDTSEFVGEAGISNSANRFKMGEIHYNIDPGKWGLGFATEIAMELVRFGFDELGLHRIQAGVATENSKSIRVLEKIGMYREGMQRKILPIRGEWIDNYRYAIIEDDR